MKYIDADELKAHIQFLIDSGYDNLQGNLYHVLSIINSLQQEQKTNVSIVTPNGQVENPTFEEYLRGVFEINNGIENDPDNLVRIHAPELLKLARKQEQPEVDLAEERKIIWHNAIEEVPTNYGAEVLVACRNKNKEDGIWLYDLIQYWEGKWEPRVNWETPVRWVYIEDVDNARKEESKWLVKK